MAQYPTITAGQRITAALLLSMLPLVALKTANTDKAATTVLADDPDLTLQLAANAVYRVEIRILYATPTGASAPLFKTAWTVPSGTSGNRTATGPGSGATDSSADNMLTHSGGHAYATTVTYGGRSTSSTNLCIATETAIVTTTAAGTLALQWAQATSSASPVRVAAGSSITAYRIG